MPPDKGENMIGTAREIALEMLRDSDLDGEKYVFASWSRNDIRGVCLDWDLTDEELDEVLEAELYPPDVSLHLRALLKPCSMSDARSEP
jgi:hypothetical protein